MGKKKKKKKPYRKKNVDTTALFNSAITSFNNGQSEETKNTLLKIIRNNSSHADAYNLLGIIQCQEGRYQEAIFSFRKAIKTTPLNPQYHNNLGIACSDSGDQAEAILHYEKALNLNPDYPDAAYNLGISLNQTGYPEKAADCYRTVIDKNPGYFKAYNNLGSVLLNLGKPEEAVECYNKAISLNPGFIEAYNNLGNALHILKRPDESILNYKKVLELNPSISEVYSNLGSTLADIGNNEEACFWYRKGVETDPANNGCWQGLADTLTLSVRSEDQESFQDLLTQCLLQNGISKQNLSGTVMEFLKAKYGINNLNEKLTGQNKNQIIELVKTGKIFDIVATPLVINFMKNIFITDPDIEQFITEIRRALLDLIITEEISDEYFEKGLGFVCALANQSFLNNYVFFQTEKETEQVEKLRQEITDAEMFNNARSAFKTILCATYKSLNKILKIDNNIELKTLTTNQLIADVIRQHILEPIEEENLKTRFDSICKIENDTSQSVRTQYEENPYPRWLDLPYIVPLLFSLRMKKIADNMPGATFNIPAIPDVLIAGCGTGSQALNAAAHFPDSNITAIDLSRTSLAYAARKAKEAENKNIRFLQGDILEFASLNTTFDIIECTGVLHHMKDPVKGWQILTSLLKPGGFMLIGLYSEIARRNIVAAREFIRERGFSADPPGIRNCRKELFNQPEGSVLRSVIYSKDFYTLSACRDLLFHVQEYRFTIPEIAGILNELGLDFIGFEFGKQAGAVSTLFKNVFPEKGSAARLDLWHKYEEGNPHSFSKMYQFWVRKK